jgi:polygalacturonase
VSEITRRALLKGSVSTFAMSRFAVADADPWSQVPGILGRIQPPRFPDRAFEVSRYGAAEGGKTDCTEAFGRAIDECSRAGGGRVVVPAGVFLTGAIHLKSNVNLHLAAGSVVRFSRDERQYLPLVFTRWEGVECMNYSPFIYAYRQENIAITGSGTLDGQADCAHWWPWKGKTDCGYRKGDPSQAAARAKLGEMGDEDVPVEKRVFGPGAYLRPMFIESYLCRNVLIEGVTIHNSPMYEVHPVLCRNVTVRGLTISSHGPNNDGCDPESSTDVLIEGCTFDTGDDCIAIKSGRNRDGRRVNVPCENLIIRDCTMKDGHGGVTVGSEASGGVRNVFADNCRMDSPNLDRVLRLKTNSVRGGFIENIYMRNITAGPVTGAAIDIDLFYEEGHNGKFPPGVRNIVVEGLRCRKCERALNLRGYDDAPIRGVRVEKSEFEHTSKPDVVENVKDLVLSGVRVNGKVVG